MCGFLSDWSTLKNINTPICMIQFYSFCELPEGRDFLASRHDFLEHLLNIMVNHGFTSPVNVSVAEIMMQVSVNPDSHSFLAQKSVVKTLLDNPYFWENRDDPRFECLSM